MPEVGQVCFRTMLGHEAVDEKDEAEDILGDLVLIRPDQPRRVDTDSLAPKTSRIAQR